MRDISWSYSVLERYARCPYAVKLKTIDRIKEPALPLPPGVTEHANDRGTNIHNAIEAFVAGQTDIIPAAAATFEANIRQLRKLYELGFVQQEQEWGIDKDWQATSWQTAWGRMKLDALVLEPGTQTALVIDHKTGKYFGNEVKHAEQGALYQAAVFARYPDIKVVITEFWYLDHSIILTNRYVRGTVGLTIDRFNRKVAMINMDTAMRAKPDKFSCKYCGYAQAICSYALPSTI